jgi:sterol desaturase/sphingolipid hydroxylase (fatty acid hydroxylase superfamily)
MQISQAILINAVPALIIFLIAESVCMIKEHRWNSHDALSSIVLMLVAVPMSLLMNGIVIICYTMVYEFRLFDLSHNLWYAWLICFLADDFSYYWFHRLSHQVRFLWASHAVHHSSTQYTLYAALRVPWTGNIAGNFLFWGWIPLLGIEPAMILFTKTASFIYQFSLHTEKIRKLPRCIEAIFVTPSHHRVHHSCDIEYLDKNHGGNLIVWDKMFRTFKAETRGVTYGLREDVKSNNPVKIAFHEWQNLFTDLRNSSTILEGMHYIFDSPGWSPDNSSKTARQLQKELNVGNHHEEIDSSTIYACTTV